jgi:hypothetical protein
MASTETLIKDFVRAPNAWKRFLLGGLSMYLFLPFGYFRRVASQVRQEGELGQLPVRWNKAFLKSSLAAWPLGAFYAIVPLALAWSWTCVFHILWASFLVPFTWGVGIILSLTLTSVALVVVEEDAERYFLGLSFEDVIGRWWHLRRVWAFPALLCYGLVALLGSAFYGFGFFLALEVLVRVVADAVRSHA